MLNYKKEYKFDFAKCMKFFLTNINKCIERNDVDLSPKNKVQYTITCYSYPYEYDVIKLIENTFLERNIAVKMKSFKLNKEKDSRTAYVYEFNIGLLDVKKKIL